MKSIVKASTALFILALILTAISTVFIRAHAATNDEIEVRAIAPQIRQVFANSSVDVVVRQGAVAGLQVHGSPSARSHVITRTQGNNLYIESDSKWGMFRRLSVEIVLPQLDRFELNGSGNAEVSGFQQAAFSLLLSGSGDASVSGQFQQIQTEVRGSGNLGLNIGHADSVKLVSMGSGDIGISGTSKSTVINSTGSGNIDAAGLKSQALQISSFGSGDISVFASQSAQGQMTGSGNLTVLGKPAIKNISKQGSGDLSWQ